MRHHAAPGSLQRVVLVFTTGRSGSLYFANIVNASATNASAEHEPDIVDPGLAARWFHDGDEAALEDLVKRKARRLRRGALLSALGLGEVSSTASQRLPRRAAKRVGWQVPWVPVREVYVEVNNSLLKHFTPTLLTRLPVSDVVHVVRDPLEVARSAVNRGTFPNPQQPYFLWPTWPRNVLRLTNETAERLNPFQLALWYWFEMESRFRRLVLPLVRDRVHELELPQLNDEDVVAGLLDRLGITTAGVPVLGVGRHEGPVRSTIGDHERASAAALVDHLDPAVLDLVPASSPLAGVA